MLIKHCLLIVTQNEKREILENYDILIKGNTIKKIAKNIEGKADIDAEGKIVLPGLINCHCHNGMQSLRGLCDDKELHEWLERVVEAEKKLTKKDIIQNIQQAIQEHIRYGTTTIVDSYAPLTTMNEAMENQQIRAFLMSGPNKMFGNEEKQLEEIEEFLKKKNSNELITIGLSAHSIYACSKEIIQQAKNIAKKYNTLFTIHLAETRKERYEAMKDFKQLPLSYLKELGILDKDTLVVHAVWLTKGEIKMIQETQAKVVHCPISNMKLASGGTMPLTEMWQEQVTVGLGTDSVVSNNNLDLFEEMKVTGLLHKYHRWDSKAAPVQKILDMATREGAKVIGMEDKIGSIEEGKYTDIILVDNPYDATKENVVSHLVYAYNGMHVNTVIIDGKIVLQNNKSS